MKYIVMCNDHANALHHMLRYHEEHPEAIVNRQLMQVHLGRDTYYFFNKEGDTNKILSMQFDGMIIPPGYKWFDNAEIVALSKVRYNHVSHHPRPDVSTTENSL